MPDVDGQEPRREVRGRERGQVGVHGAAAVEVRLGEVHDTGAGGGGDVQEGFFRGQGGVGAEAGGALLAGAFEVGGELLEAGFAEGGEGGVGFGGGFEGGEEGVVVVGGGHGGVERCVGGRARDGCSVLETIWRVGLGWLVGSVRQKLSLMGPLVVLGLKRKLARCFTSHELLTPLAELCIMRPI